jgi:hypothetical protein
MQEEIKKTSYNLSEWKTNIIGEQLVKATNSYQTGKLRQCFFIWKSIVKLFDNRLSDEEYESIKLLEKKAFKNVKNIKTFSYYLDEYTHRISKYMNKYGLDFSDKEEWRGL